jgi:hypothetical protein
MPFLLPSQIDMKCASLAPKRGARGDLTSLASYSSQGQALGSAFAGMTAKGLIFQNSFRARSESLK